MAGSGKHRVWEHVMSATIWLEVESGSDRAPVRQQHNGYWSGNQRDQRERDERQLVPSSDRGEMSLLRSWALGPGLR
jgi:hypothetical protein